MAASSATSNSVISTRLATEDMEDSTSLFKTSASVAFDMAAASRSGMATFDAEDIKNAISTAMSTASVRSDIDEPMTSIQSSATASSATEYANMEEITSVKPLATAVSHARNPSKIKASSSHSAAITASASLTPDQQRRLKQGKFKSMPTV